MARLHQLLTPRRHDVTAPKDLGLPARDEASASGPGGSLPDAAAAPPVRPRAGGAVPQDASPESLTGGSGEAATDPLGGGPVAITVIGRPAPQGSKRHVGRGVMVESSQYTRPWRESVKEAVRAYRQRHGLVDYRFGQGVPLTVKVAFHFDRPKSAPKRRRVWPVTRSSGDVDKLLRSTLDALVDAGLIWDDSQVVTVVGLKVHTDDADAVMAVPGAAILIAEVTDAP